MDPSRIIVMDHLENLLFEIDPADVFERVRTEEINGEHSLTITTTKVLEKEQRILTVDGMGRWREYVVMGVDAEHQGGNRPVGTYWCPWSLMHDLAGTYVTAMPGIQIAASASQALAAALGGTSRWTVGTVTETAVGGASMYYRNGYEALGIVTKEWGGEVDAEITVSPTQGVTGRAVNLYHNQGDQTAKRRFDYSCDMQGIRRKVLDSPVYVRVVPRGKGVETESGGFGRRIDIKDANNGIEYLHDDEAEAYYKLKAGNSYEYPTAVIENGDCETPAELKEWAESVMPEYTEPKVTYEADVVQLARAGMDIAGIALGDAVHCVDRGFSEAGMRVHGRVTKLVVNELDSTDVQVTIGYLVGGLAGSISKIVYDIGRIDERGESNRVTTADLIDNLLDYINADINATGGYAYIVPGEGIITYDHAVADPLIGSEASQVVQIKGGSIRIADEKEDVQNPGINDWKWRTVFVSGHVLADLVTAVKVTAGYIGSADDTFIDLDNHTVQLGQSSGLHTVIDSSGMEILDALASMAFFGELSSVAMARIGKSDAGNVVMSGDGYIDIKHGSDVMAHFGYASGYNGSGGTSIAPYYTLGTRSTQSGRTSVGNYSTAIGVGNAASGYASAAIGWDNYAYGNAAVAIGDDCQAHQGVAIGVGAAANPNQVAVGVYNSWQADTARFIVGEGTASSRNNSFVVYTSGNAWLKGTLTQGSDRRLKKHLAYLKDDAVAFIRNLKPALFEKDGGKHLGFYAQDVQEVEQWDSETVGVAEGCDESLGFDPLTLDYTALIAPLVAYAQKLEERIEQLEK